MRTSDYEVESYTPYSKKQLDYYWNVYFCRVVKNLRRQAIRELACLRWSFGSSLLPPTDDQAVFVYDFMSTETPGIILFFDYLLSNYIDVHARFSLTKWYSVVSDKTRNTYEAFHSKYNNSFNSSQYNYITVKELKEIQEELNFWCTKFTIAWGLKLRPGTWRFSIPHGESQR